jgi:hypothetical protein
MSRRLLRSGVLAAVLIGFSISADVAAQRTSTAPPPQSAEQAIASWKAKPREVAQQMIKKYGTPQEVTANRLIWHNNGPWKFTELVNEEIPHTFPVPHHDMLYQVIDYRVDPDDADELLTYDGSVVLERTKGELAARCDKEEANFLAINLANDIATGKRSVADARRFYAESMAQMMKTGEPNEYLKGFRFTVPKGDQGDRDKPSGTVSTSGPAQERR